MTKIFIAEEDGRIINIGLTYNAWAPCECHPAKFFDVDDAGCAAFVAVAREVYDLPDEPIVQLLGALMLERIEPTNSVKH